MSLCELGCGPGWMTRMAARHGLEAVGYDISPGMIEIAREQAEAKASTPASRWPTWRSSTPAAASTPASLRRAPPQPARRPRHRDRPPRAQAGRPLPARRAELEAPLPGPRRLRRVRRDRARLHARALQEDAPRRRVHGHRALPQQPQAALRQPPEGGRRAPRRAVRLPDRSAPSGRRSGSAPRRA